MNASDNRPLSRGEARIRRAFVLSVVFIVLGALSSGLLKTVAYFDDLLAEAAEYAHRPDADDSDFVFKSVV